MCSVFTIWGSSKDETWTWGSTGSTGATIKQRVYDARHDVKVDLRIRARFDISVAEHKTEKRRCDVSIGESNTKEDTMRYIFRRNYHRNQAKCFIFLKLLGDTCVSKPLEEDFLKFQLFSVARRNVTNYEYRKHDRQEMLATQPK